MSQSESDSEIQNIKEKKKKHVDHTWFRENENTNFRRLIMFPDDEGHITEYIQIKLSDKQNALLDKECREFLKQSRSRIIDVKDINDLGTLNHHSNYVIISRDVKKPKTNFDLVNRFNDLIKECEGKTYLKHIKGHSDIYGNEQADKLAYLDLKKPNLELVLPE
ncbi:28082_t:CDS:2, partial [Racocetra persica]